MGLYSDSLRDGWSGDQIPVEGEIFRARPDRPWWGPPSLLYSGYRVFPRGTAAGAWRCSPTPSSAQVKERVDLHSIPILPLWAFVACSKENFAFTRVIYLHWAVLLYSLHENIGRMYWNLPWPLPFRSLPSNYSWASSCNNVHLYSLSHVCSFGIPGRWTKLQLSNAGLLSFEEGQSN